MRSALNQFPAEIPCELDDHFARVRGLGSKRRMGAHVTLLCASDAADISGIYRAYFPVLLHLGGIVLDEEGEGGHHVYLSHGALTGSILHFAGDDVTRVVFSTLEQFQMAVEAAANQDRPISDHHPKLSPIAKNQAELRAFIASQLDAGGGSAVIQAVLPSFDLCDHDLLCRMTNSPNDCLVEAVAIEIRKRPRRSLRDIATACAVHRFRDAAIAGLRALQAIDVLPLDGKGPER